MPIPMMQNFMNSPAGPMLSQLFNFLRQNVGQGTGQGQEGPLSSFINMLRQGAGSGQGTGNMPPMQAPAQGGGGGMGTGCPLSNLAQSLMPPDATGQPMSTPLMDRWRRRSGGMGGGNVYNMSVTDPGPLFSPYAT